MWLVSVGTPVLAFLGVLLAQFITRKGANELETRSKREETLRVLRWAAELAVSDDPGKANLGVYQLNALADSDLLDEEQTLFVEAALEAVVDTISDEIEEAGQDAEVSALPDVGALPAGPDADVSSETDTGLEGEGEHG